MNEELKTKVEGLKSMDDVYQLACEGGYQGSKADFEKLVKQAADDIAPMKVDDLEQVAGGSWAEDAWDTVKGGLSTAWDAVSDICTKGYNWVCEHPIISSEIAVGVATVGTAIGVGVHYYRNSNAAVPVEAARESTHSLPETDTGNPK